MPEPRPLTALVCDHDPLVLRATAAVLTDAGFEIVSEAGNAIEAIRNNEYFTPSLVVITHEQTGLSGLEALPDLHGAGHAPEVVLIAIDGGRIREQAQAEGAFAVAEQGDGAMLERIVAEVKHLLETGERRSSGDRRTGEDRRKQQDWSKVIRERRSGDDRRGNLRREQDVTGKAAEVLRQRDQPEG